MAAPTTGDRPIWNGTAYQFRAMTVPEILSRYPLVNPTRVKYQSSITSPGFNDAYTVPAGKRALILSSKQYVSGAVSIGGLAVKRGGSSYQLGSLNSANTIVNTAAYAGFVFEPADIIQFTHGALNNTVNYTLDILLFDAPVSGPRGLFTSAVLNMASGDNTMVTCGVGYSIEFPILGSSFSTPIGHIMNNSGGNIATLLYIVPNGGTADSTNLMNSLSAQATNARVTLVPSGKLDAGDFVVFNTDTAGNQVAWITCFEGVF